MPIYRIRCTVCGSRDDIWRTVANRDNNLTCGTCEAPAVRVLSAPMIAADCFNEYISPGTGRVISSPSARDDDLKRSGAILAEPGIEKDVARNKASNIEKSFAPIASGIDEIVTRMVNDRALES